MCDKNCPLFQRKLLGVFDYGALTKLAGYTSYGLMLDGLDMKSMLSIQS